MSAHTPATRRPGHRPACQHRAMLGPHLAPPVTARLDDDDLLLLLLVSTWELATARPAPPMAPADMTEDELIEYWSDPTADPCPPDCPAPHPGAAPGSSAEPAE